MARMRTLKPDFFSDIEVGDLTPCGRLLFAGLWCYADREGRLPDDPRQIKHDILPYDRVSVDGLLETLAQVGFILRYSVGGVQVIQVENFAKHQRPHPKEPKSSLPPPPETHLNGASREKTLPTRQEQIQEQEQETPPEVAAPPDFRERYLAADTVPKRVAAVIDLWKRDLSQQEKGNLGGIVKELGGGQDAVMKLTAAQGAINPLPYLRKVLSNAKNERRTGRGKVVAASDLPARKDF